MPKIRLVIAVMVLVGAIIIGEAVYVFTRPGKIELSLAIILVGIALAGLFLLMGTLFMVWKGLNKTPKSK